MGWISIVELESIGVFESSCYMAFSAFEKNCVQFECCLMMYKTLVLQVSYPDLQTLQCLN